MTYAIIVYFTIPIIIMGIIAILVKIFGPKN